MSDVPPALWCRVSRAWARFRAALSVVVLGTAVVVALVEFPRELLFVFRNAPAEIVPGAIRRNVDEIRRRVPDADSVLYVMDSAEHWNSRIWHRALYPTPVLILTGSELGGTRDRALRRAFAVKWALSVGKPPVDPGYRWRISLLPDPKGRTVWFGELRN
jgi:hypothetical protein